MPEPTLLHHIADLAASRHPDSPAATRGETTLTHGEVNDGARRFAGWLRERGLGRGDRMVIALPSFAHLASALYGASRAGVVFAVVHEQVEGPPLEHILADCEPALLITDSPMSRRLADRHGIRTADSADLVAGTESGSPANPAREPLQVDPVCLIYTSGSTALPKAVVCTHQQVMFAARAIHSELGYRPDDTVYCPLPMSFDYGMYQIFLTALGGAHLWLGSPAEVGPSLLTNLSRAGSTVLPAVPAVAEALVRLLRRNPAKAPPLRLMTNTGAAMPQPTLAALRRLIPTLRVQLMFGLTECKRVSIMPPDEDLNRPGACGRPLPGTEVFVVDEDGDRLGVGAVGELVVRGPHVMAGYWRSPESTAQRFQRVSGLFPQLHTGDYGWLDQDGYVYFAGRRDDLYKERGFRVSATEVESAARRVPGVEEAAVIPPGDGRRHAVLFVVTRLAPEDVLRGLRRELEDFKIPGQCLTVDALPLTGNGKADKKALLASLEQEAASAR